MELSYNTFEKQFQITMKGEMSHHVSLGTDARGNLTRLDNALAGIPGRLERGREQLENLRNQQSAAQVELTKPFPRRRSLPKRARGLRNWTLPSVWRTASTVTAGRSVRKSVTVSDPLFWRT